jgi:antitoxin YefM
MALRVSYSYARRNLGKLLDVAESSREAVIIKRRGHDDVALIPARELRNLTETVHLLRSPRNVQRLFSALRRALGSFPGTEFAAGHKREPGLD